MKKYTKEQILIAAEIGEVSMIDARHIVSLLDEAVIMERERKNKNVILVRCINPKNTDLKTDKIYEATESEYVKECYIIDVGWNLVVSKDMFEVLE